MSSLTLTEIIHREFKHLYQSSETNKLDKLFKLKGPSTDESIRSSLHMPSLSIEDDRISYVMQYFSELARIHGNFFAVEYEELKITMNKSMNKRPRGFKVKQIDNIIDRAVEEGYINRFEHQRDNAIVIILEPTAKYHRK